MLPLYVMIVGGLLFAAVLAFLLTRGAKKE